MCGYTLESRSVTYYLRVTVTLTSGLSSKKIVSGAYILYYLTKECDLDLWPQFYKYCVGSISPLLTRGRNPKFSVRIYLGVVDCYILFSDHLDLDLWPHILKYLALRNIGHKVTHFLFVSN